MWRDVRRYGDNCAICRAAKHSRQRPYGLLKPLPAPPRPWQHVTLDFITNLPVGTTWAGIKAKNILVVVDRHSKDRFIIPCWSMTSKETACLVYEYVWRHIGLPDSWTSDRGAQFIAHFWKRLCKLLHIDHRLSTAYHPQIDR